MKTRFLPLGLVAALLGCGSGCAKPDWIEQTLVTVDVTGTWVGSFGTGNASKDIRLELKQQGPKVEGAMRLVGSEVGGAPAVGSGRIEGGVTGDRFTFRRVYGRFTGEMLVNEDEMTGFADTGTRVPLSFRRVKQP
jgi:hypothetical protein